MKAITVSNVQAEASAILTGDGAITIHVMLTVPGSIEGQRVSIGTQQHWLGADDARPIAQAPMTAVEFELGLPPVDLLVARALVALSQQGKFLLLELIPEAMRPATA